MSTLDTYDQYEQELWDEYQSGQMTAKEYILRCRELEHEFFGGANEDS